MTFVVGRDGGGGPVAHLGHYRARDGSSGARLALDVDRPHAVAVVGKRGYGKSYTLGVLAEELAVTPRVAPVVLDPMGAFRPAGDGAEESPHAVRHTGEGQHGDTADSRPVGAGHSPDAVPARVVPEPRVAPDALAPRSWCALVGLAPDSPAGALVWEAASTAATVEGMCRAVGDSGGRPADVRAARNHLRMADRWDVFDADGLGPADLAAGPVTVLDLSGLDPAPTNAVGRVVADSLYRARVEERLDRLPWVLVDEAHAFFGGVAADGLRTLLTRGRAPGVSIAVATQRPAALPTVCLSQSDVLVSHRLTSEADLSALESARPTYMDASFDRRMPTDVGEAVVVDDSTETVHAVRVRERTTPHGGDSPRASDLTLPPG